MKAIETKYLGATAKRGARIVASDSDGNRVSVPYLTNLMSAGADRGGVHREAAAALCRKMGWTGELIAGGTARGYAFVFLDPKDGLKKDGLKNETKT